MPEPRLGSLEHRNFESIIDKIAPKAFTKQQKPIPKCIKNNFHQKSIFAIPSMSEPRLGSPWVPGRLEPKSSRALKPSRLSPGITKPASPAS